MNYILKVVTIFFKKAKARVTKYTKIKILKFTINKKGYSTQTYLTRTKFNIAKANSDTRNKN